MLWKTILEIPPVDGVYEVRLRGNDLLDFPVETTAEFKNGEWDKSNIIAWR